MKKTKIVATMSDFRCTEEFVKELFDAGMDVIRVNSAHVTEEGATRIVEIVHKVNPAIPIMIDTKGPEIRVTTIADEYGNSIHFRAGDRVAVRGSDGSDMTTRKEVYMNVPTIVRDIPVSWARTTRSSTASSSWAAPCVRARASMCRASRSICRR